MIEALIEIGRTLRGQYLIPIVEIPYVVDNSLSKGTKQKKKSPKVIVVNMISNIESTLEVANIELEDYDPRFSFSKYFFRNPPAAQGPAPSLCFKLPAKESSLAQRLGVIELLGFKKTLSDKELAGEIFQYVKKQKENGTMAKKQPILVVIKIDGKWPAEVKELTDSFKKNFLALLADYKKSPLWKVKGKCHICGKEGIIYGGLSKILKFYTVDKYGYAPELNPKIAWKQYALCEECIFDLERGKRAVDDFLKWHFYGKEFWLLPVSTGNLRKVLDRFKAFHNELSGKAYEKGFESLEDRLLYEASIQEEAVSYHFVFVQKDNQALRIKLHIEEVLPSVLREYVNMKKELEDRFKDFVNEAFISHGFSFNFFSSKNLKVTNQKPGFTDEDFYMLVDKVFRRSPVDERYLILKAMSRISKDMAEAGEDLQKVKFILRSSVLETLLSLVFLHKWGILKRKIGGIDMSGFPYEEFFERHGDFFNHPAKRGLVLLGVLVQKFLNEQYKRRQSTPFLKVLKNLRLDQKDVQRIYVALQNKMNEYEIGHWWPKLREGISLNFIEAGNKWPLSPDEIGFYVAVGMSLYSHPAFGEVHDTEN